MVYCYKNYVLVKLCHIMGIMMKKIEFTLNQVLKKLNVTPNKVATLARVAPKTVYALKNNNVDRVHIDTLENILHVLNEVAAEKGEEPIELWDLMKYK